MRDNIATNAKFNYETGKAFPENVDIYNKRGTHLATINTSLVNGMVSIVLKGFAKSFDCDVKTARKQKGNNP